MITLDTLYQVAPDFDNELREFRLTGDLTHLLSFVQATIAAEQNINFNQIWNDFFNHLTDNENKAFLAIREEINSQGNISIVKMIQKTNLSRPVFTSLLTKMEKYGVAEIRNQGVKGTYINMREGL